jgi:hypothetical protein
MTTTLNISKLMLSSVLYLYTQRETIQIDPPYQRMSDVWTLEKRQLLVDSILNGYDIPKLYFHKFTKPRTDGSRTLEFAIIDGKQRLESIWQFVDGRFPISDDFEYVRDPSVKPAGLNYRELGRKYPSLKLRFDSFPLDVVTIETDDLELIEDMFSRLNEAVPLSAAERRNALGGPLPQAIRRVAQHAFFTDRLPFGNSRYRHFDLAAKFLYIEAANRIVDTKKVYLDNFVRDWQEAQHGGVSSLVRGVREDINSMSGVFTSSDPLLRSVGMVVLYYHAFRIARQEDWLDDISRDVFQRFEIHRARNREFAEADLAKANYELLEFDRYTQSPNDAYAIQFRLTVLLRRAFKRKLSESFATETLESEDDE